MKRTIAAAVAVTVVTVIGSASASESTIVPGVGIGKIKLGMTLAQVEQVLGKDYLVNSEGLIDNSRYRELAWNFATWSVVFLRRGFYWRVIQVETTLSPQRTARGIGVSSPFKRVVDAYPQVFCNGIYSSWGPNYQNRSGEDALILVNKSVYTAFAVKPSVAFDATSVWRVYAVIVQQAIPGHVSLRSSDDRCDNGWRERGRP